MSAVAIRVNQRTPEWHAARQNGVGSSDGPIITGDAPWGDLLQLYAVKAGIIDPPNIDTPQTRWGLLLEDVVATWFSEETGRRLRRSNQLLRHPEHLWMLASLDRVVVGEKMVCEIKTARYPGDEWGETGSAEIPAHYLVQVQHQIAVTGFDGAYVAVLFAGSDPRWYVIPRDESMIEALIELEAEFWACVRNGTPPEALIRRQRPPVIPLHDGEIVADETLALGIAGVHGLRAEIKQRKEELDSAEEAVKTLLGPNTAARAGAYRAIYRQSKDGVKVAHDLIASAYRKRLAEVDPAFDAESIASLFTAVKTGNRPLLVSLKDEAVTNAA